MIIRDNHMFVLNTSIKHSFVGLFNPFAVKTKGFSLTVSQRIWLANSTRLLKKKTTGRRKGSKSSKALYFQEETMHKYIRRQNWLLENQELFLMHWPRKINCKVLWGLLKIYKKNGWAVLVDPDVLFFFFFLFLMTTNNSLTQYNFILDCKRRSCVKPSARRRHRAKPELAFISSWADKQRHWDQVRKGWSPQIWKSNVGKRGSACWWLRCTLCWAWLPSLRQSSVLAPWFPDLSEWFALKWQRASLRNSCTFSPSSARSVISCWSQTPWRDSAFWYPNSKSRPGGAAPLCPWVMFKVPHHTITSSIRFCTVWIHNCTVPKCGFYSALSRLHFTTTSRGVIKCTISLIFKAVRTIFLPPPPLCTLTNSLQHLM